MLPAPAATSCSSTSNKSPVFLKIATLNFVPKLAKLIYNKLAIKHCQLLILGIDPGYATTGFGLIDIVDQEIRMVDCGVITTLKGVPQAQRIQETVDDLLELIDQFQPDQIAIEEIFFSKNVTTALKVAECRGAIIYQISKKSLPYSEYKPNQVKINICGYGGAPKIQVQKMVQLLLNLKQIPQPDDAADALAIAVCHANHYKQKLNLQN